MVLSVVLWLLSPCLMSKKRSWLRWFLLRFASWWETRVISVWKLKRLLTVLWFNTFKFPDCWFLLIGPWTKSMNSRSWHRLLLVLFFTSLELSQCWNNSYDCIRYDFKYCVLQVGQLKETESWTLRTCTSLRVENRIFLVSEMKPEEENNSAENQVKEKRMPQKRYFRQRAHVNPLSDRPLFQ